jgi:predicted transcriptional regulator
MRATEKLRMLADAGAIDEPTRGAVDGLLPWLREELQTDLDADDVAQMMVTHLAMATSRARSGAAIDAPAVEDPAVTASDRERAIEILRRLARAADCTFAPSEEVYLAAYVGALRIAA